MPLEPIRHRRITDEVYASLRAAILGRDFAPGQRIDVDALQRQLGVSRTPLKDALNRLAMEGLVRVVPRQGTFVAELGAEEIAEVCDVRCVLELYAVEQGIMRMTPEQLTRLRAHFEALRETRTPDGGCSDHLAFVCHDHDFHRVIVEASGNQKLRELYETLNVHIQMARVYYLDADKRIDQVCQEHERILAAYEARDLAAAKEAVATHLATAKEATLQRLAQAAAARKES